MWLERCASHQWNQIWCGISRVNRVPVVDRSCFEGFFRVLRFFLPLCHYIYRLYILRMLLAFSQPVNCIFWPIKTHNWLVAASKLHNHWGTGCTAEWPYCPFAILWCDSARSRTHDFIHDTRHIGRLERMPVVVESAPAEVCVCHHLKWRKTVWSLRNQSGTNA